MPLGRSLATLGLPDLVLAELDIFDAARDGVFGVEELLPALQAGLQFREVRPDLASACLLRFQRHALIVAAVLLSWALALTCAIQLEINTICGIVQDDLGLLQSALELLVLELQLIFLPLCRFEPPTELLVLRLKLVELLFQSPISDPELVDFLIASKDPSVEGIKLVPEC